MCIPFPVVFRGQDIGRELRRVNFSRGGFGAFLLREKTGRPADLVLVAKLKLN